MPRVPQKHCFVVLMTLVFLLNTTICLAAQCLSPSPTLRGGKDPYLPIVTRQLTLGERQSVRRMFDSLAGEWKGRADSFFCMSMDDPADVATDRETILAHVTVDYYGNLSMQAELYSARKKAGRQEILTLYQNDQRFRIGHDTAAGDVEVITISDDTIAVLYRRVVPVGRSGSSRREHFFTLTTDGDVFTVERLLYIQGRLSSGEVWRFERN